METEPLVVHNEWNGFGRRHGDVFMTISFDDDAARNPVPQLKHCARIIIPILETRPNSSFPVEPESEILYGMEDEITDVLQEENVSCRLVARLTYDGLRELVFQFEDEKTFRPVVGRWIQNHTAYEIDVSEHEGWEFFDDYIRPTESERRDMAESRVIDNLIENGSDLSLDHDLEYSFTGERQALEKIAAELAGKGYQEVGLDFENDRITFSISMPLDRARIKAESDANESLAEESGANLDGWGASTVSCD